MGLSATQVRLLSLTARQHATEYHAQKIQAQKLQLANESDRVYQDYLAALDATKVQYKKVEDDGSFVYDDATFTKLADQGFLFNVNGTVCNSLAQVEDELKKQNINVTASDSYTLLSTLVSEGLVVIMQQKSDSELGYSYDQANGKIVYTHDNNSKDNHGLNDADTDGNAYTFKVFENTSMSSSTKIDEVSDETSLKKTEAQYEADMNRINAKDKRYDNELSQLETERNAIKTELETLQNVAKDNVERTFKIFS